MKDFSVVRASNTDEALRKLRDGPFDLALSDIVMPGGLSGLDLARTLREHHPELPLVLATGYSERASEAVAQEFVLISKPFSLSALARAIQHARLQKSGKRRSEDRIPVSS